MCYTWDKRGTCSPCVTRGTREEHVPHVLHMGHGRNMFPMCYTWDKGGTGDLNVPHVLYMEIFTVLSNIL